MASHFFLMEFSLGFLSLPSKIPVRKSYLLVYRAQAVDVATPERE